MTIDHYRQLTDPQPDIIARLAMPEGPYIEFEPKPLRGPAARPIDLE